MTRHYLLAAFGLLLFAAALGTAIGLGAVMAR